MLINEELKKKIVETLEKGGRNFLKSKETKVSIYEYYADAFIAAGIGDVEQQRDIFKKTYMNFFERLNRDKEFRKKFDSVTLGCQIGMFEDILDKAEKELAEERKYD